MSVFSHQGNVHSSCCYEKYRERFVKWHVKNKLDNNSEDQISNNWLIILKNNVFLQFTISTNEDLTDLIVIFEDLTDLILIFVDIMFLGYTTLSNIK